MEGTDDRATASGSNNHLLMNVKSEDVTPIRRIRKVPVAKRDAAKRQTWQPRFVGPCPTITALRVNNSRGYVNYSG